MKEHTFPVHHVRFYKHTMKDMSMRAIICAFTFFLGLDICNDIGLIHANESETVKQQSTISSGGETSFGTARHSLDQTKKVGVPKEWISHFKLPLKSFFFLRHGQTDWNKDNRIMGQMDIPLNETGREQAISSAVFLKNQGIQKIIASPLSRTKETAEIIQKELNVPLFFDTGLMECRWGPMEGSIKNPPSSVIDWTSVPTPKGAESIGECRVRVMRTMTSLLKSNESILIISHGGIFHILMEVLGYPGKQSDNCEPYHFKAPTTDEHPWVIYDLKGEK